MKKSQAGFTLIELVIVIIIVAILAAASVPIYRNYVRRAVAAEGTALAGTILAASKTYFLEHQGVIAATTIAPANGIDATLGVNSASNRYFRTWTVTLGRAALAGPWTVTAGSTVSLDPDYNGLQVTFTQTEGANPAITVTNPNP